jgi:ABC-type Mn2+/Zn2+ transport system permease subunit
VITALAVVFGAAAGLGGLYASNRWNVAAGAGITLAATGILMLSSLMSRARRARIPAVAHPVEVPA